MRWQQIRRILLACGLVAAAALLLATTGTEADALSPHQQQAAFITTTPTPTGTPTPTVTPTPTPNVFFVDCEITGTANPATVAVGETVTLSASLGGCTCDPEPNYETPHNCYYAIYSLESMYADGLLEPVTTATGPPAPLSVTVRAIEEGTGNAVMRWYGEDARPGPGGGYSYNWAYRSVSIPIEVLAEPPTPTPTPTATPTAEIGDFEAVLSGQITLLSTGDPIFGAEVCATLTFPAFERCAYSAFDGNYSIRDLTPGNYSLQVTDPSGRFVENCWGSSPCDAPDLIGVGRNQLKSDLDITMDPIFSASFPTPTVPPPSPEGSIAGQVIVAGEPRAEVEVCAVDAVSNLITTCTVSGNDGFYALTGLTTANYRVEATIYESGAPVFNLLRFCYLDDPGCTRNTVVGVVSPFSRSHIKLRLDSSEFDEARITITPTPVPTGTFQPIPTPASIATPTPTPTSTPPVSPTPIATPTPTFDLPPIPYSDFERSGPWTDVPHVGTLGVGTYATGTYRFGSPKEPVIALMSDYFGPPSGTLNQGRVTWWGPRQDTPLVRIEADGGNRLVAASINLEENARLGRPPVFLGDVWLFSGNFPLDAFGLTSDRFIYLEDNADGHAVRCAQHNFCTIQYVERDGSGNAIAFGNIIEFFAEKDSAESVRITGNVTADGLVQLRTAPSDDAPALRSIDLSGGVTAGIVGDAAVDDEGTVWLRLTEGRDPLRPAGWARADDLTDAPVADRLGPLPRLTVDPPELASLIGETHDDIFDSVAELLGIDNPRPGSGGGIFYDSQGEPMYVGQFVRDGHVQDQVLSDRLPDGTWQIVSTARLEIGTDQVVISPTTGRCPRFGGAPNDTLIVTNLDKDVVAVWELHDREFRRADPTGVRCDLQDRG